MRLPRSLYAKLALGLTGLLVAMAGVYALLSAVAIRHYEQEVNQEFNRDLARNLVMERNLVEDGRINQQALEAAFHHYMTVNPSIEIYLVDLQGRILSYSADPGEVRRERVSLEPIGAFLQGDAGYPLLGDDPRHPERRKEFSVTPVPTGADPEAYLYVILRGERLESVMRAVQESYLLRLSAGAVGASLIFGLAAGLVIFRLLTRRVRRLSGVIERFRDSGFTAHEPYLGSDGSHVGDEVDQLGETFDRMAERIIEQLDELKDKDATRRELVAQVSHDLRTPLAALHGYLETLKLKEGHLPQRDRAEYLATALRQSDRLRRRVEELFELAKLDARDISPDLEPCSLAELAQDVVQKFGLGADERGIRLELVLREDTPAVVRADVALMERVLENLVENALQHTPSGGLVRIEVRPSDERVIVGVTDSGAGIAEPDLARVFEPFYRAGERNRSDGHAGLGLTIARRIVQLHGGHIDVESRVGVGTTFTFRLPALAPGSSSKPNDSARDDSEPPAAPSAPR